MLCLHGLTGGSYESYVRNSVAHLTRPAKDGGPGMRVVVLNSRGCADTPVTSPYLYSGAETSDTATAVLALGHWYPQAPIVGLGFSLGGSILTKYITTSGKDTPMIGAISVCAPYEYNLCADVLDSTYATLVFSSVMFANVRRLTLRHIDTLVLDESLHDLIEQVTGRPLQPGRKINMPPGRRNTLRYADELITRRIGGRRTPYGMFPFASSTDYYNAASTPQYFPQLQRPLILLSAYDDPLIPGSTTDSIRKSATTYPHVVFAESACGGHLGYYDGSDMSRWLHVPIVEIARTLHDTFSKMHLPRPRYGIGSGGPQKSTWVAGTVDTRTVQVEVLPEAALRRAYPDADLKREQSRGTHMAWLRTKVLPLAPLVHPRNSPAGFDESTPSTMISLKMYQDALRPEIGFAELPAEVNVGGNGTVISGHNPGAPGIPAADISSSDP